MTRVSISPNLAERPAGGPETASSGSFPPRSPETYLYIHPTLSTDDRHGEPLFAWTARSSLLAQRPKPLTTKGEGVGT